MNKETRHAVKGGGDISSARDKLSNLPNLPGVYLFKDDQQSILYIGKIQIHPQPRPFLF